MFAMPQANEMLAGQLYCWTTELDCGRTTVTVAVPADREDTPLILTRLRALASPLTWKRPRPGDWETLQREFPGQAAATINRLYEFMQADRWCYPPYKFNQNGWNPDGYGRDPAPILFEVGSEQLPAYHHFNLTTRPTKTGPHRAFCEPTLLHLLAGSQQRDFAPSGPESLRLVSSGLDRFLELPIYQLCQTRFKTIVLEVGPNNLQLDLKKIVWSNIYHMASTTMLLDDGREYEEHYNISLITCLNSSDLFLEYTP